MSDHHILKEALEAGYVTEDLKDRLWLARFLKQEEGAQRVVYENSVCYNFIDNGPPESFDLHLTLNFKSKQFRLALSVNEGCGPEATEVFADQDGCMVAWLQSLEHCDVEAVSPVIASVIEKYPKDFRRLIQVMNNMDCWLNQMRDQVEDALIENSRPNANKIIDN